VAAKLEDNVIMAYVGYFPLTSESARQEERSRLEGWAQVAPKLIYRPNYWVYFGSLGLPQVAMKKTVEDFRFLAENNCIGVWIDTAWEHWATTAPQYYLMAQLGWNPYQDGQAVLEDYYRRGFGSAAGEIRAYWELMEEELGGFAYRTRIDQIVRECFSTAFRTEADRLLNQAAEKVLGEPDIYRERVSFVRAGYDFSLLMLELVPLMKRARQNGDAEALNKAKEIWDRIKQIDGEHPCALNYQYVHRSATTRGRDLLPQAGKIPEEEGKPEKKGDQTKDDWDM
jgi:hypothetical protein